VAELVLQNPKLVFGGGDHLLIHALVDEDDRIKYIACFQRNATSLFYDDRVADDGTLVAFGNSLT
jgi:hypothetical protein